MSLWITNPEVLLQNAPQNPFKQSLSRDERANSFAQLSIGLGVLMGVHRRSLLPIVVSTTLALVYYLILPKDSNKKSYMAYYPHAASYADSVQQASSHDDVGYTGGVNANWSYQSQFFPNNPNSLVDYGRAVRSTLPTGNITVQPSQSLARMYSKPGYLSWDQQTNPIPDPTFMAQQPFNTVPNVPRGQYEILSMFGGPTGAATGLGGLGNPSAFSGIGNVGF